MPQKIAVVGAGISGLASAWLLRQLGYQVTVFARDFYPGITSARAAAFWFPYHIRNDQRGINWCKTSYFRYQQLSADPATGISMKMLHKVVRKDVTEEHPAWTAFMPEGALEIKSGDAIPAKFQKVYSATVPLIETQIFLPWLQSQLEQSGAQFISQHINSLDELSGSHHFVINCSALGSKQLCNDSTIIPVRGQVALLSPLSGMDIYLDNERPLYVVPRKDAIIVGGTYEENIDSDSTEPEAINRILQHAMEALPELKQQHVCGEWAGLRPYRKEVRVEQQAGTNIIHNYGHGGSGFTLAFGCAASVVSLVQQSTS